MCIEKVIKTNPYRSLNPQFLIWNNICNSFIQISHLSSCRNGFDYFYAGNTFPVYEMVKSFRACHLNIISIS